MSDDEQQFRLRVNWRGRLILQRLVESDGPRQVYQDVRVEDLGVVGVIDVRVVPFNTWVPRGTPIHWPR